MFTFSGSGDHDMCVPFTGSEAWTRSVGYKIVDEWRPWTSKGQIAGYFFCFPFIKPCKTVFNELNNKTIENNYILISVICSGNPFLVDT